MNRPLCAYCHKPFSDHPPSLCLDMYIATKFFNKVVKKGAPGEPMWVLAYPEPHGNIIPTYSRPSSAFWKMVEQLGDMKIVFDCVNLPADSGQEKTYMAVLYDGRGKTPPKNQSALPEEVMPIEAQPEYTELSKATGESIPLAFCRAIMNLIG